MTKAEAIHSACYVIATAYHGLGDYSDACDCFCDEQNSALIRESDEYFRSAPGTFLYATEAILSRLLSEGKITKENYEERLADARRKFAP